MPLICVHSTYNDRGFEWLEKSYSVNSGYHGFHLEEASGNTLTKNTANSNSWYRFAAPFSVIGIVMSGSPLTK